MVAFLGFYAAAELSHFVEIVPRVPVSAVKWKKFGKMGFRIWSMVYTYIQYVRSYSRLLLQHYNGMPPHLLL